MVIERLNGLEVFGVTDEQEEIKRLKQKVNSLIADNLELSSQLECDYDSSKSVRKLTLQEKLGLNMGNLVLKYRLPVSAIKNIYFEIMKEEKEPQFIDVTFDNDRMFRAFYKVDLEQEKEEIEKGDEIDIDINKLPENMKELEHHYDMWQVLNQLTTTIDLTKQAVSKNDDN